MTQRDRDRSVDRLLESTLRARAEPASSAQCPDAETLAAWIAGGLGGAARSQAETHVAGCARCQAHLAAMSRMPSALPTSAPRWPVTRMLTWLAPLAAAGAAIAVWVWIMPGAPPLSRVQVAPPISSAEKQADAHASSDVNARTAAKAPGNPDRGIDANASSRESELRMADRQEPKERTDAAGRRGGGPEGRLQANGPLAGATAAQRAAVRPAESAPVPLPASPTQSGVSETGVSAMSDASRIAALESAKTESLKAAAAGDERSARAFTGAAAPLAAPASAANGIDIVAPDSTSRWRISGGVRVQRSTDGGATWEVQSPGTASQLTSGSSPAPAVCWLVGRGGVVLLTTDGRTWRRLAFPEEVDLTAVRATDASHASVTTVAGRSYSTQDAGATWVAVPPQEFSSGSF